MQTKKGPEDTLEVLTPQQAGELLNVRPRQLQRMGVPVLDWGHKTKRYVKQDVLAWLEEQRRHSLGRRNGRAARLGRAAILPARHLAG